MEGQLRDAAVEIKAAMGYIETYLRWAVGGARVDAGAYDDLLSRLGETVAELRRLLLPAYDDLQRLRTKRPDDVLMEGLPFDPSGLRGRSRLEAAWLLVDEFYEIVRDDRFRAGVLRVDADGDPVPEELADRLRRDAVRRLAQAFGRDFEAMGLAIDAELARIGAILKRSVPVLEANEQAVLLALAERPGRRLVVPDLEQIVVLTAKPLRRALRSLHEAGLVDYPPGTHRGAGITPQGREIADSLRRQ